MEKLKARAAIEMAKPKTRKDLLKLSKAVTAKIIRLEQVFMENDSELETFALDDPAADFECVVRACGFDMDVEEVIANREWCDGDNPERVPTRSSSISLL